MHNTIMKALRRVCIIAAVLALTLLNKVASSLPAGQTYKNKTLYIYILYTRKKSIKVECKTINFCQAMKVES